MGPREQSDLAARCLREAVQDVVGAAARVRAVPAGAGPAVWRSPAATAFRDDVLAVAVALDALADDLAACAVAWHRHADDVEAVWRSLLARVPVPGLPSGWGL